jgi:hypothetical protein
VLVGPAAPVSTVVTVLLVTYGARLLLVDHFIRKVYAADKAMEVASDDDDISGPSSSY